MQRGHEQMGTVFTKEQQKAINTRNADILVSAAAGSGKTAVLVERIMGIITDEKRPVDIDNLLIVTFTSAAAAEMRERIGKALAAIAEKENNEHILRQLTLVNYADITTIHSFCMKVVRENYTKLNIDHDFRIADENECGLIKAAVLEELFERRYGGENNESFLSLVETFGESLGDSKLKDIVLDIHGFIQSMPFPEKYLKESAEKYNFDISAPFDETMWGIYIKEKSLFEINEYIKCTDTALNIAVENGPESYAKALTADLIGLNELRSAIEKDFDSAYDKISSFKFVNIGRVGKDDDKKIAETIKAMREIVKKGVSSLEENFFFTDIQYQKEDVYKTGSLIKELADIVTEFSDMYSKAKRERNTADFNDLEHFALKILIDDNENGFKPSKEALQLQKKYYEVMTDEYQDSNPVQEMILLSVSGRGKNENNRFMVGDVKQSIYRFRQAEPGLFMEKYNTYKSEGEKQRIDLFKNFRSRKEVLDSINFLFRQIMFYRTGEMEYSKEAWLYPGGDYPESEDMAVEIDVIEKKNQTENEELDDISSAEAEMIFTAKRIRTLMESNFKVYDIKEKKYRNLKYSDIAIIMRKTKNWGKTAREVLERFGIPSYSESPEKYFERKEISDILSILSVIDNSRQDIPLIASLKIDYYGFTNDDLLKIRAGSEKSDFYDCVKSYALCGSDKFISDRLKKFFDDIEVWKKKAPYMSVGELIWDIYSVTGYYDYTGALNNGDIKQLNLMALIEKADELEKNNFKGLFNFIRYIERLQKTGLDFGAVKGGSENSDVVHIMTVHKSKGLEFPVVFLCGMGNSFNKRDSAAPVLMHRKMGLACDFTDIDKRIERITVSKKILADKMKAESLAEEMRVLYVAMTRAKEKLIITGSVNNIEKKCSQWAFYENESDIKLPYYAVTGASDFLDWICMCVSRHRDGEEIREAAGVDYAGGNAELFGDSSKWKINLIAKDSAVDVNYKKKEEIDVEQKEKNKSAADNFEKIMHWKYDYENIPANLYVSEIKRIAESENTDLKEEMLYYDKNFKKPDFLTHEEKLTSAQKGTAMHTVLENMNFRIKYTKKELSEFLSELEKKNIISESERKSVSISQLIKFVESDIYSRIIISDEIHKEQPFVMEVSPYEVFAEEEYKNYEEKILVHGMIDCYFKENDNIVLIDYKTDYVDFGHENELIEKYKIQLKMYKNAIERAKKQSVSEIYIYSLYLGNTIKVL